VNEAVQLAGTREKDLVDRIADALPLEVRADYYRELRHCRSLPENDEMLRILRIMQFLTLLIQQAPQQLAAERERLDKGLSDCTAALEQVHARLDALPKQIASSISPEAIATKINESLRQQFQASTIPQTGQALATVAVTLKRSVADFQQSAMTIDTDHRSAAADAARAVREINQTISRAAKTAEQASMDLTVKYGWQYNWSLLIFVVVALLLGFFAGSIYEHPPQPHEDTTAPHKVEAPKPKR
jgi:hypothetical protein